MNTSPKKLWSRVVAISLCATFSTTGLAQQSNWVDAMYSPGHTFQNVKNTFYNDWQGHEYVKGQGWKQFHRWENFWETRLMPDGSFPNFKQAYKDHKIYMQGKAAGGNWSPIGPFTHTNTDSWSPGQGRVNFVAEDPNNSNTIYIGAPAGGIWKSTDAGSTWTPLGDDLAVIGISSIAIAPTNSNIIYVATGDADGGDTYSIGVMKSTDAGLTWNEVGNLNGNLRDILVDPGNENVVYVAANNGLFKSTNGGNNWSNIRSGSFRDIEFKPSDAQTIYAAQADEVHVSTNGGTTWNVATGIPTGGNRIALAVTPANNNYVYVLRADGSWGYGGIYRSTNSGTSFTARNTTTDVFNGSNQAWFDMAIGASSTDANTIFTGVLNVWRSTNGGTAISQINNWSSPGQASYTHADIHFLRYYGGNFYCGSDGGIYRSTNDGNSFTDLTAGLQIGQFYRIGGSPNDLNTIAGGLQDNGGYVLNSGIWKNYYGADGMEAAISPTNSDRIFGMIQNGSLYRSTNGGNSSQGLGSPENGRWVTPMQHDPNSGNRVVCGYNDLHEYTNGWNQISTFNFPELIRSIEIYDGNSNIMYVATDDRIWKTTNGGGNMTEVTNNLGSILGSNIITSIEVDPADDNRVWVSISGWSAGNKVAFSSNGGTTWTNISGTLPNLPCNIVKFESNSAASNAIYVGTDIGVYYRDDILGDFQPFNTNLPNVIVNDLEINETAGIIRAGTYGRGVWESGSWGAVVLSDDAGILQVDSPTGQFCGDTFTPEVTLRNSGSSNLTSVEIHYQIDANPPAVLNWTGNLAPYTNESVTLPSMTQGGSHTFTAWTEQPNSVLDQNLANDTASSAYNGVTNGIEIFTHVIEDCWGSEVTWTIEDATSSVVLSGGPYADGNPLNLNRDSVCVEVGCYDFIINDTYGDGMFGSQYGSCNDDGDYYIITEFGDTVVQMNDPDFGSSITHNFCVSAPATADFTSSSPSECVGQSFTFSDNSSNATSWSWDFGANATPATATGAGPHVVTYSAGGTKTVALQINGTGPSTSQTVTVNALPSTPTISTSGATTICDGASVSLTSSQPIGNVWSTTETSSTIAVTTSGSYSVTYTDPNGCVATSAPTVVTVNAIPTISSGTVLDPHACATATGSIQVAGSGTGDVSWSGTASGSANGVSLPYTIPGLAAGSYNITFTNTTGCASTVLSQSLTDPNPPATPTITASGAITFCDGGSVDLVSSQGSGNAWTTSETSQTITVTTTGTYAVTYTDGNGCSASSAPINVTVNPNPTAPTITASGPTTFCAGGSVDLVSSYGTGNSWSTLETTQTITITTQGAYNVTYTDGNGCSAISSNEVIVINANPTVDAGTDATICDGDDFILNATGANTYVWDSGDPNGSTVLPAVGTTTYSVTGTDANGCTDSDDVTVTVNPLPTVSMAALDTTCTDAGVVDLTQGSPAGGIYSGPGVTGTQLDPASSGPGAHTVTYSYTDANGCTNTATTVIIVEECASLNEALLIGLSVYPNPMTSSFAVSYTHLTLPTTSRV